MIFSLLIKLLNKFHFKNPLFMDQRGRKGRQMLPTPNTFEPAPNIISKIPKIPFILEMKIQN